jgi:hypothetical protein
MTTTFPYINYRSRDRQPYGLTLYAAAAEEPVTAAEVKAQARIDLTDDDAMITTYLIPAARDYAETFLGRKLVTQTWDLTLDYFPSSANPIYFDWGVSYANDTATILLPNPPVSTITSITYTDTDGATQTLSASGYTLDTKSLVARLGPSYGNSWPSTYAVMNAVTVRFVCGYGAAAAVPPAIRQAILILAADMYQNRETDAEMERARPSDRAAMAVERLLWANRVVEIH